ncbi:Rho GTPase activation protein [Paraphysoderma sedebokerense]|nr:Rho GTPase activation protein [Paraphysoderma sedebokerense]
MTKLKDLISPVKSSAKSPQSEYAAMEHQPLNGKALPTKPKEPSVHSETTQYSNDSITGDTPTDLSSRNGSLGSIYEIPSANDEKKKGKLARLREKAKAESEKWKEKGEKWKAELSGDIAHTKAQMKQKMKKKKEEEDAPEVTVFGSTLEDAVRVSRIDEICPLPAVVIRSIEYLDTKGLNEVGLYRIPGSTTAVAKLKAIFDHGGDIDMILSEPDEDAIDPHNVATLLKMYFRERLYLISPLASNCFPNIRKSSLSISTCTNVVIFFCNS